MYQRLTVPTENGYEADGRMAIERLGRLEDALDRLRLELDRTSAAMERFAAQGKTDTEMYRQLAANRASLEETLLRLGCR